MMNSIHNWLSERSEHYKNWHLTNYHSAVHWSGLTAFSVLVGVFLTGSIYGTYVPDVYAAALPSLMVMGSDNIPNFSLDASRTTVTAVKSGSWSDPTVWSSGSLPNSSQIAVIPSGKSITYDSTSGTAYTVFVQGDLKFRTDINTLLTVTNLEVDMTGYLEIGTVSSPVNSNVTAEVVIANTPIDTNLDPEQWGTGFLSFGKVKIAGATKNPTFIRVASEPLAGQTTINLSQTPTGWKVGDRIFIPDTRHYKTNEVTSGTPFRPLVPQWEEFTIQGISGNTITLNRALTYNHKGARDVNGNIDFLPHVGNLTRNVIFRSASPTGTRGHMAMMHTADVDIRYATFLDMGRTTYDPVAAGTNQKGRYPLHMHHLMGPLPTPANGYQFTLIGNAVDGGSSNHKFKWGITVHDSHYGLIQDNVVYNMGGAGIMTEDGNETMNVFDHNFVVRSAGTGDRGDSRGTSEWGYEGAGIWLRGPNNILRNNVTANFTINGIAYFHIYLGNVKIPNYKGADTSVSGQYTSVNSYTLTIPEFDNNEIYGSGSVGLTNWWLGAEYNTPRATGTSVFKNTKIWHVADRAIYNYPGSRLTYDGLTIRGDASVLPSASCCGIGYEGGDYFANNITLRNVDVQGMTIGLHISTNSGGTQLVENSTLRNKTNMSFSTLYTSDCNASKIPPRLTIVKNTKFMSIPGIAGKNISMDFSSVPVRNIIQKDEVFVVDYNQVPGDNFRVYFNEADPNYIVPQGYYSSQYGPGCVSLMSVPVSGLTNSQVSAQYGYAIGGTLATCSDTSTHPEIKGITCPFTSISSAPLTPTVNPTNLLAGPITGTTPPPTTQTATLNLSASPATVTSGGSVTLTWSSTVATSCTASGGWTGTKATSGSQVVNPTANTTYTLTCGGTNITSAVQSVSVVVTAVAAPSLTISASPTSIISGGSSTITWSSSNVTSCTASGAWSGIKSENGSVSVSPTVNSTYTLDCVGTNGTNISKSVTVNVSPLVATVNISASPTTISSGGSSTLNWSSTNASTCTASGAWSGTKTTSGSASVFPTATSTYSLTCSGTNVSPVVNSVTVNVIPPVFPSPTISFSASPSSITAGDPTTLTWSTTAVSSCNASGAWSGSRAISGSLTINPSVTSTYTLSCIGTNGSQVSQSVTVNVSAAPIAPLATVTISASPTSISGGGSSTITWSSTNATSCTASGGWSGTKSTSGSLVVLPTSDTTYTLTCSGANTTLVSQSATISVSTGTVPVPSTSPVVTLSVSDSSLSAPGNVTLSWSSTNATSCTASGDWGGLKSLSGIQVVSISKTSTFNLTCVNSSMSSVSQSVTVTLSSSTTGTGGTTGGETTGGTTSGGETTIPVPTDISQGTLPVVSLSASPLTIKYGQAVTLTWYVTGATSASISGIGAVSLSGSKVLYPTSTTTYTLTAESSAGFASKSITVGVIIPPSAIAHWKMNSESGTTVYDSSRYGFTGYLLNGATWSIGYLGGSVKFDGINDYITFGNKTAFNIVGDLTITAWVNHRTQTGTDTIISKGPCNNVSCPFSLRIQSNGTLCFIHNNGTKGQESICTATSIPLNTWNHVAVVRSGKQVSLYVNGVLKKTATTKRTARANSASLTIGGIGGAYDFSFDGRIDDVRLFNKALTLTEIKALMTQQ